MSTNRKQSLSATDLAVILFSRAPQESDLLERIFDSAPEQCFDIEKIGSMEALKARDIEREANAILIDMRIEPSAGIEAIEWVGSLQSKVALIAICCSHERLRALDPVIDLIDDYIPTEHLSYPELSTRTGHAIRRRAKEHALVYQQNLFNSLLENIPDKIFFKDLESRFIKVNEAMASTCDFSTESIVGKTDFDIFTREHAQPAYQDEKQIIESGLPLVAKIERETFEDGSVYWAQTTKVPLRDAKGRIRGTMGIARDVTELKIAQDKLSEERTLLKAIISNARAGIFVKDREGKYVLVNKKHSDYLGAPNPEFVKGKNVSDFFDEQTASIITSADMEIIETGKGRDGMIDHRSIPGRPEKWLLSSKFPLQNESGECSGLVGVSIDITREKENEQALRQAIKTLEETKLQLIESEKLKTVGRMAAGVAHEVKNPLNVIALSADYLKSQIDEPHEFAEIIDDMVEATDRANEVVMELLDLATPHPNNFSATDLNELLGNVCSLLKHNFAKSRVKVQTELLPELPNIAADPSKMEQVFINLCLNAVKAMERGGTLSIRSYTHKMKTTGGNVSGELTERFRIGDPIVSVEIKDTGHGIAEQNAHKLFDPFFSTNSTGEGTGLGLSVTRSIVEIHHGIITLSNREDGQGACAQLHFPAQENPHTPIQDAQLRPK